MSLGRQWIVATVAAVAVLVILLAAVELLAVYGGRPIVNNPRPAAAKPLRINTLYIEYERTHR